MTKEIDILLVEDNDSDAELTIQALKRNNLAHKLLHVKDGIAALDFLFAEGEYIQRNLRNKPKIILLDLNMPKLNGIQVLQKIRTDERTRSIPVVILTSSKEDMDIDKCYALGANSYIVKPIEFVEFQKAISHVGLYWMMVNQQLQ